MEFFPGVEHPLLPDFIHYPDDDFFQAVTILTSEIHHHRPEEIEQEQKQKLVPVRSRSSNTGPCGKPPSLPTKLVPIKDALSGRSKLLPENVASLPAPAALEMLRAGFEAECRNVISQASRHFEAEFNASPGEEYDSSASTEPERPKKKEIAAKKLELLMENISNQLMQKLEQMHEQLMEILMEKEQASIILEEAWKQQEIEWAWRREERALETSRNLALISFIQNLLEHRCQHSNSPSIPSYMEHQSSEILYGKDLQNGASSRRWSKPEVQALITIRTAVEHKLLDMGEKGDEWKDVAARLGIVGYKRTPAQCREKWENINRCYKKMVVNGERCPKLCPCFDELDMVYKGSRGGGSCMKLKI